MTDQDLGADAAAVATAEQGSNESAIARHTPGPWRVGDKDVYWRDSISIEGNGEFGGAVCCTTRRSCEPSSAAWADAHLIAAAPEMKAGLLKAVEALEDTAAQAGLAANHVAALPHQREWLRNEVRAIADPAIKALRELIAKAEGRQRHGGSLEPASSPHRSAAP